MADAFARLHPIDCACDVCKHIGDDWAKVEEALAEARSRRKEADDSGARRNPAPPSPPDPSDGAADG